MGSNRRDWLKNVGMAAGAAAVLPLPVLLGSGCSVAAKRRGVFEKHRVQPVQVLAAKLLQFELSQWAPHMQREFAGIDFYVGTEVPFDTGYNPVSTPPRISFGVSNDSSLPEELELVHHELGHHVHTLMERSGYSGPSFGTFMNAFKERVKQPDMQAQFNYEGRKGNICAEVNDNLNWLHEKLPAAQYDPVNTDVYLSRVEEYVEQLRAVARLPLSPRNERNQDLWRAALDLTIHGLLKTTSSPDLVAWEPEELSAAQKRIQKLVPQTGHAADYACFHNITDVEYFAAGIHNLFTQNTSRVSLHEVLVFPPGPELLDFYSQMRWHGAPMFRENVDRYRSGDTPQFYDGVLREALIAPLKSEGKEVAYRIRFLTDESSS